MSNRRIATEEEIEAGTTAMGTLVSHDPEQRKPDEEKGSDVSLIFRASLLSEIFSKGHAGPSSLNSSFTSAVNNLITQVTGVEFCTESHSKDSLSGRDELEQDHEEGVPDFHRHQAGSALDSNYGPISPIVHDGSRESFSRMIERVAEGAENRNIGYRMGGKANSRGQITTSIDCSGFVDAAVHNTNIAGAMTTNSEGQIAALERMGVNILTGSQVNAQTIGAGFVIGIDTGNRGWDAGRARGIDHVLITYQDTETGRLMIADSNGRNGVTTRSFDRLA